MRHAPPPPPNEAARLVRAFRNTSHGLRYAITKEASFRFEVALLVLVVPSAFFLSEGLAEFVTLVGAYIAILIIELLNTAMEQVCNLISRDFRRKIKVAKDCGSAAVFLTAVVCLGHWTAAVFS